MKSLLFTLTLLAAMQEEGGAPPDQPHTTNPAECKIYCHPAGSDLRPRGVPSDAQGQVCAGEACAKAGEREDEDRCHEGFGCTTYCSKPCCTCLLLCL